MNLNGIVFHCSANNVALHTIGRLCIEPCMTAQPALHPFSGEQWRQVHALLETLDTRQALWLRGYLAAQGNPLPAAEPTPRTRLLVAWGPDTGHSKRVPLDLAAA